MIVSDIHQHGIRLREYQSSRSPSLVVFLEIFNTDPPISVLQR
jgi:hypothetical protein